MTSDPFDTRRLREAALAAWTGHPARFREDANAEEDHGRGYYRDRVVVELAQNAADAASRAGVPGRLLLRLTTSDAGAVLVAANTGAPLDAVGVASLASLRASAKRAGSGSTVGRFGVGFAAVRSVADEITVASAPGAVHFSLRGAAELLGSVPPDLAAEVDRRQGSLPVLRLPFAGPGPSGGDPALADDRPADGWDTVVVLALRDEAAVREVRRQLAAVDDPLLLALPSLVRVEVQDGGAARVMRDVTDRWVVATRTGLLDPVLLADRPVEERERTGWQVTWAVRRGNGTAYPSRTADRQDAPWRTVHAPTPTDEPCTLPALLVATFPLDPSRRHVAPGPLTDALVGYAGETWADLVTACRDARAGRRDGGEDEGGLPGAPDPLDLLPTTLPGGALDAAVRGAVVAATRTVPLLTPVDGGPPVAPVDAVVLSGSAGHDPAVLRALAEWLPHLVEIAPRHRHLVEPLGLGRTDLTDVVDALPHTDPFAHRRLYEAFTGVDSATLEELATLPVPLADGRTVRGCRGLVILDEALPAGTVATLGAWGIRAVHPDAAHPLLERLGASRADAAALLGHPVVRERVLAAADDGGEGDDEAEAEQVAEVVLGLVRVALGDGAPPAERAWWGEILVPADDGGLAPARGLVMPGSDAARWFDPDVLPPVDAATARRWARELPVLGVRTGLTVVQVGTTGPDGDDLDDAASADADLVTDALDGWPDYLDDVAGTGEDGEPGEVPQMAALADLDAVRADAWPEVLVALTRGDARRALVSPVRSAASRGMPAARLVPYTAWWLRHRGGLGLGRPFALPGRSAGRPSGSLADLLAPVPDAVAGLDDEVLRALGGVSSAEELDAEGWADLLDALPAVGLPVTVPLAAELWRGLAGLTTRHAGVELDPDRLPALVSPTGVAMVAAEDVAVGSPRWAQHPGAYPLVVVPEEAVEALADVLDVDVVEDRCGGTVTSTGREVATPGEVVAAFPDASATWFEHEDLRVDGVRVDWWVEDVDGRPHAATTAGLARALAVVVGWAHRDTLERLLTDPGSLDRIVLEHAGDGPAESRSAGPA